MFKNAMSLIIVITILSAVSADAKMFRNGGKGRFQNMKLTGTVCFIDPSEGRLVIKSNGRNVLLVIDKETKITLNRKTIIDLTGIQVNDRVTVRYAFKNGFRTALKVEVKPMRISLPPSEPPFEMLKDHTPPFGISFP